MSETTKISWCHSTYNPVIGCEKVAAECANCYAAELDSRRFSKLFDGGTKEEPVSHWGPGAPRHRCSEETLREPLQWNSEPFVCSKCGKPARHGAADLGRKCLNAIKTCDGVIERRRVFCGSLCDWADSAWDRAWRDELFDLAERCDSIIWMFLTKRGEGMVDFLIERYSLPDKPIPKHFWFGMSWMKAKPEDVTFLSGAKQLGASVTYLSVEPMLGPFEPRVDLLPLQDYADLVIFGGESGHVHTKECLKVGCKKPEARVCDIDWIRKGNKICRDAGVKIFNKQVGSRPLNDGILLDLKDKKGGDMAEWPKDVRIQEMP